MTWMPMPEVLKWSKVYLNLKIMESPFRDLTETEQRQFAFEVTSRCNFHPDFYYDLITLMEQYEAPFEQLGDKGIQILKPEFRES
jgi:hypothetical protein